jgi:hypothetical protein
VASLILDSGALIAVERGDRRIGAVLLEAGGSGIDAVTSSACVAEVWRNPARQPRLTRALRGLIEVPVDAPAARQIGELLAIAGTSDISDAAVALLASTGDVILTSDPSDIEHLIHARGVNSRVQRV